MPPIQAGGSCIGRGHPPLTFDSLVVQRKSGRQATDEAFVQSVHAMTLRSGGDTLPIEETRSRLGRANLGHYVYVANGGGRELVAYTLNELFDAAMGEGTVRVNYFCSAFLLPETRTIFSLYRLLGAMRITGREHVLLMRTQNPLVMTSFSHLCRRHGYRTFSPLSENVPLAVREALKKRFSHAELVHRSVYPGRIGPPTQPRTERTARLMSLIEPEQGDACVFAATRPDVVAAHRAPFRDVASGDGAAA